MDGRESCSAAELLAGEKGRERELGGGGETETDTEIHTHTHTQKVFSAALVSPQSLKILANM